MLYVLDRLIIPIHAHIGQETDITQEIIEFVLFALIEFIQSARILTAKRHLHYFAAIFVVALLRNLFKL